ncbi:MAG: hypothetical protein AAF549_00465 [Pseudomonadota bacterium]
MVRFIGLCFGVVLFSFAIIPVFSGISDEKDRLDAREIAAIDSEDELTFEEIYEIASEIDTSPEALANIAPAAGDEIIEDETENFSAALKESNHPAL